MANIFTVKINWVESNALPVRDYVDTKQIKELNDLTFRKCINYPKDRGYDKVGFEILVDDLSFYSGKYYVQKGELSLYDHIKEFLPHIAPDDEIIAYIIDVAFGKAVKDDEIINKYFAEDRKDA